MSKPQPDLIQGTLDLLILKVLEVEPMHGWGIGERIQQLSEDVLQVNQGSLYPALHRLVRRSWITSSWKLTEHNRKARYYRLTVAGARQLAVERDQWARLSAAVNRVLATS